MQSRLAGRVASKPGTGAFRNKAPRCPLRMMRATNGNGDKEETDKLKEKYFKANESAGSAGQNASQSQKQSIQNPVELGRAARRAFDDVWSSISALTSPTRSYIIDDTIEAGVPSGFEAPQAAYTKVLVVGATGRVGRIVSRKLLLRGYKIKALVRNRNTEVAVPPAVEVVYGDLADPKACQEAVRGVQKIIFCAAAKSTFTADLLRVEDRGVMNIAKAFQDELIRQAAQSRGGAGKVQRRFSHITKKEIADFDKKFHQERWDVVYVGNPDVDASAEAKPNRPTREVDENRAVAEINDENNLVFEGYLPQKGAIAEVGAKMVPLLPDGEHRTKETEGLVMRVRGDGHQYVCVLRTTEGHRFSARFPTRTGYLTVRLPYSAFRSETMATLPPPTAAGERPLTKIPLPPRIVLNPENIDSVAIRYEHRKTNLAAAARIAKGLSATSAISDAQQESKFQLEVDWIKAIPGGEEPDFILVSCAGKGHTELKDEASLSKLAEFKKKGEENLRLSGLGYSIIRPGTLVDEPGGYKALVFDQGDRISEDISAADVADIAIRAVHEPEARNKTFDVCYEYQATESIDMYELVANVPDKKNNYLKAAVSTLQRNT